MISVNSPRTGTASKWVRRDLLEQLGHLPGHHDLALAEQPERSTSQTQDRPPPGADATARSASLKTPWTIFSTIR
jgi:hypothetical protein